jgi:FlaA1/EpsC-like NDP-sugar epimerase
MDLKHFPVDRASFDGAVLVTGAGGCIGSWVLALLPMRTSRRSRSICRMNHGARAC